MKPKRNLWPVGIVSAYTLFIAGMTVMIVIACSNKSELVTANYYEQEVNFQTRLDQLNRTAKLSDRVKVAFDDTAQRIQIWLPAYHALPATSGKIHLYRPSSAGLDRELRLRLDAAGLQSLDATQLEPGLWKIRIHWVLNEQEFFADKSVLVKRGA